MATSFSSSPYPAFSSQPTCYQPCSPPPSPTPLPCSCWPTSPSSVLESLVEVATSPAHCLLPEPLTILWPFYISSLTNPPFTIRSHVLDLFPLEKDFFWDQFTVSDLPGYLDLHLSVQTLVTKQWEPSKFLFWQKRFMDHLSLQKKCGLPMWNWFSHSHYWIITSSGELVRGCGVTIFEWNQSETLTWNNFACSSQQNVTSSAIPGFLLWMPEIFLSVGQETSVKFSYSVCHQS